MKDDFDYTMGTTNDISDQYEKLTQLEHLKEAPDVWGAANKVIELPTWIFDASLNKFVLLKLKFSPLWLKIVDEVIVNAIDQHTRFPKEVKNIIIDFDIQDGSISVFNDGPGIPVIKHNKYHVWIPQLTFCEFLAGSNFKKAKKGKDKTTGGKNGIGAKLTNAFSTSFTVETSDKAKKLYYIQESSNGMSIIDEPIVTPWDKADKSYRIPFTRVSFTPNYIELGYKEYTQDVGELLMNLLYTRCVFAATYCSAEITLNDKVIPNTTIYQLSTLFVDCPAVDIVSTVIKDTATSNGVKRNLHWDVTIAITDDIGFRTIGIINGIFVKKGGSYINHIVDQIFTDKVRDKLKKEYKIKRWSGTLVDRYLFIFVKASIEEPLFNSQAKEEMTDPGEFPHHKITTVFIKQVLDRLKPQLDNTYITKTADSETKKKKRINAKKYEAAEKAGGKESMKCSLFIPEGDSAEGFINWGVTSKATAMGGYRYYGIFNIQGKPMNARKEITIKQDKNGRKVPIRSYKLKENERWSALVDVLGLDYTYEYKLTPDGDREFAKLRYGCIIVAVDQDVDGVGHIFGLILNFFHVFWPTLIDRGFIKRLTTPIIRAFPNNKKSVVLSFYSDEEYTNWCQDTFNSLEPKGYIIRYFKGLASHNQPSAIDIFKKFKNKLYVYSRDNLTDQLFESYFGKETTNRKSELRLPLVKYETPNNLVTCTQQLQYETKEYQMDDIVRSLPHVIDGLRPAARLAIAGAQAFFKKENKSTKLYQLTGDITKKMHYQHGEKSLNDTVIRLAQSFPGARNLPYIFGDAMFGSRSKGGGDSGAPRYIFAKLNKRLTEAMFPHVDEFLLKYNYDDGERCEPMYYTPVLPTILLESFSIPATGWATRLWARNYVQVISNVRLAIAGKEIQHMDMWLPHNTSTVIENGSSIHMIGKVQIDNKDVNKIYIKEMPPGVWDKLWKAKKIDDPLIESIANNSSDRDIDIEVIMKKGYADVIESKYGTPEMDYLTHYLGIYIKDATIYNCLGMDNRILELTSYMDMFHMWFDERKKLYVLRIDRRTIVLNWLIIMYENMIKYSDHYAEYKLSGKKRLSADSILREAKYIELNKTHIEESSYGKTADLNDYILKDKSYSYLLSLSDLDRLDIPNAKRREKLDLLKKELEDLQKPDKYFKGARLWLNEISVIEKCIADGLSLGWDYGKDTVNYG